MEQTECEVTEPVVLAGYIVLFWDQNYGLRKELETQKMIIKILILLLGTSHLAQFSSPCWLLTLSNYLPL